MDINSIHVVSICNQDRWKKFIGSFLLIGFPQFFYPSSAFFRVFLPLLPWCTRINKYYTSLLITLNMQSHFNSIMNDLFCIGCYYHSRLIIPCLAQIWGFWVTCGVKMMSLCHGWGWHPPQTASHIHSRHIQCVWAHWCAVHGHMLGPVLEKARF